MQEKIKFIEANQVAKYANDVKDLFFEGETDDKIAQELRIEDSTVRHLRALLHLRRRHSDITTKYRAVGNDGKGSLRISTFALTSIIKDLGLKLEKKYEWIVVDVKKDEFTIETREAK